MWVYSKLGKTNICVYLVCISPLVVASISVSQKKKASFQRPGKLLVKKGGLNKRESKQEGRNEPHDT